MAAERGRLVAGIGGGSEHIHSAFNSIFVDSEHEDISQQSIVFHEHGRSGINHGQRSTQEKLIAGIDTCIGPAGAYRK